MFAIIWRTQFMPASWVTSNHGWLGIYIHLKPAINGCPRNSIKFRMIGRLLSHMCSTNPIYTNHTNKAIIYNHQASFFCSRFSLGVLTAAPKSWLSMTARQAKGRSGGGLSHPKPDTRPWFCRGRFCLECYTDSEGQGRTQNPLSWRRRNNEQSEWKRLLLVWQFGAWINTGLGVWSGCWPAH